MWDPFADFRSFQLPNGLRCHVLTWDRPWEYIGAVVHAGAAYDPPQKEGMAHFVEHLLTEGIPGISFAELRAEFDRRSIISSFGETGEFANYLLSRVPLVGDNVRRVLDVFGQMLFQTTFDKNVARERRVVIQEVIEHFPFPIERRWRVERGKMFWGPGHRLARFLGPGGMPSTIRAISIPDLRAWHARYYVPRNVDVVACGGLSFDVVRDNIARSSLALSRRGSRSVFPPPSAIAPYQPRRHAIRFSDYFSVPIKHSKIEIVVPYPRAPSSMNAIGRAMAVINEILFRHVRERLGGDYDISVSNSEHPEGFELVLSGNFPTALAPEIERLINESLALAEDEALIRRFISRVVREWELLDMSGQEVATEALAVLTRQRCILPVVKRLAFVRALTVSDVRAAIRAFAPEKRWTLLCTP